MGEWSRRGGEGKGGKGEKNGTGRDGVAQGSAHARAGSGHAQKIISFLVIVSDFQLLINELCNFVFIHCNQLTNIQT